MRRIRWYHLAAVLALVPGVSSAVQLRWSSGPSDLSFASATRCTLVVQADPGEQRLPSEWRLLWVADSCEIRPVPLAPQAPCQQDVAEVASVRGPSDPAELAANMLTAQFCFAGGEVATSARYVLDLPAGSKGRFKVIALDPMDPDSAHVLQSSEVTFNGGVGTPFPPVILRATTVHRSTEFRLTAVGAGLSEASALELVAPDASWRHPLSIVGQSNSSITGVASLAAAVPPCDVQTGSANGVALLPLPGEPVPLLTPAEPTGASCQETFREAIYPLGMIQPKDFAFVLGGWAPSGTWVFHLFYIRQNQETKKYHGGVDATEKNIGHAVSSNLYEWPSTEIDTAAIAVRPGRFDSKHVWAPCIILRGVTYFMFYTGVDDYGDQRIGLATSTDLVTWTQQDNPIFDFSQLGVWAAPEAQGPEAQFRDPYVMPDTANVGSWLMYFVTIPADYPQATIVGVAKSDGDFSVWDNDRPLWSTLHPFPSPGTALVESPHAFKYQGKWWLFYTANQTTVFGISNPDNPTDPNPANWSQPQDINTLIIDEYTGQPTNAYTYWHASEFLGVNADNDVAYLAAWNDQAVGISYIPVRTAQTPYLFEEHCPVTAAGVEGSSGSETEPRLRLIGPRPARSGIGLRIELPTPMRVRLGIHDVSGRRVRTMVDGDLPAGASELSWDGRDTDGAPVGSGVYFASLKAAGTLRSVRAALIR
ncbi:MAG: family 43 glycosylhydrolase [Candidatus Eisenbacteria bacterium]|nr:family 43 glycosylhydrolase [Candidatus Eisenbacteria bacterium]